VGPRQQRELRNLRAEPDVQSRPCRATTPSTFGSPTTTATPAVSSATITINDVHPTADAGGNQSGNEGTGVSLHGSGNSTTGDAISAYAWDLDNNGSFETSGQDQTFNPDLPGNYPIKLRVTDDDGDTAVSSAVITITDVAPTANAGGNQTGAEGTGVTLHGSGNNTAGDAIVSYSWDLNGDNVFGDATTATTSFNPDLPGNYIVKLKVTDDDSQTSAVSQRDHYDHQRRPNRQRGNQPDWGHAFSR